MKQKFLVFPEFPERRTTLREIPKFSQLSSHLPSLKFEDFRLNGSQLGKATIFGKRFAEIYAPIETTLKFPEFWSNGKRRGGTQRPLIFTPRFVGSLFTKQK